MKVTTKWKLLAFPFLLGFFVLYVFPFGQSICYSVIASAFDRTFVGFANYQAVWENAYYRLALANTLQFTSASTAMLVLLSLALSLALHGGGRFVGQLRIAFVLPMLLPTAAVIPLFKLMFPQERLYELAQRWGNGWAFRLPVYMLYLWKNAGYNVILLTTALALVPREVEEAAALDGAQGLRKLTAITLPMIAHALFFVVVLSVVQSLRVFKEAYLLYGTYPDPSIYLVQHYMNNHFTKLNYQNLTAGAILFALPVGVAVAVYGWAERRWAAKR